MSATALLRRGALGDVVLLGAVTAPLAARGPVHVHTEARYHEVVARLRGVSTVRRWGDPIDGTPVDLQGGLRGLRRAPLARRVRKGSVGRRLRVHLGVGPPRAPVPRLYADACGVDPAPLPWLELPERTRDTLALIPGAAWAPKRWRPDRLASVGRTWDGPVVVLGGPDEEALVAHVARAVPGSVALAERGFTHTLDWLARTAVAVAGDSGLMHLAGAAGARVVALFGPTHPDDGFFVYPGAALGLDLPCRPCALHRVQACHRGHHGCMDIATSRVVEAVHRCAG